MGGIYFMQMLVYKHMNAANSDNIFINRGASTMSRFVLFLLIISLSACASPPAAATRIVPTEVAATGQFLQIPIPS